MQNLDDVGPLEQFIERRQVEAGGEGINDRFHTGRVAIGRRHLDEAQFGVIGLVAQKFGIQGQVRRLGEVGNQGDQRLVGIHDPHGTVIADSAL